MRRRSRTGFPGPNFPRRGCARELLKFVSSQRDSRGCLNVSGELPRGVSYLIGWMSEHGHAAVFARRLNLPEPVIIVRHVETKVSRYEDFLLPDGTEIWGCGVWVS